MDELIVCRNCDSPYCHGCNIYLLYQMLKAGKLNAIKDGKNTIIPVADVVPVRHGRWIWDDEGFHCSECWHHAYGNTGEVLSGEYKYCPFCGAVMEQDGDGNV